MARVTLQTNELTSPVWAGDILDREHLVPGGAIVDAAQYLAEDAAVAIVDAAGAAANAVAIPLIAPLPANPIPSGTTLYFGAAKKLALTTSLTAAGAASIDVQALPTALVAGDTATYAGSGALKKVLTSGTAIGRTFAERAAGTAFGPAAAADEETYLVAFDNHDLALSPEVELYRHGSIVKENFLPGFTTLDAGVLADIRANYQTTRGAA